MVEYGIAVDPGRCVGCRACEIACEVENGTPDGVNWIKSIRIGPDITPSREISMTLVSMPCMHCGNAPCIAVCPVRALSKRPDGIVLLDEQKCIGCKYCLWACPFGAPQFDSNKGKMTKCRLCVQRVDAGLKPACVTTCHTKALIFGTTEEISEYMRKKAVKRLAGAQLPLVGSR